VRVIDQLFTIVLVRLLAPRDFGLLAAAAVFAGILSLFAASGITGSIVQRREIDDEYLSTAFWANLGTGCVLFAIAVLMSRFVGVFLREPITGILMIVLSTRFIFDAVASTQAALITRRLQYRALSVRPLFGTLAGGIVGLVMAYRGMGVWSLVAQQLGVSIVGAVALQLVGGFVPMFVFSVKKFKDIWSFGGPLLVARLFGYAVRNFDNLLIGRFLGPAALGAYALAYSVFLVPIIDIGFPMSQVLFSTLSRVQEDASRLKQGFLLATRYITMLALPMMVGLSIVAPLIVSIIFGSKWDAAAPVMRLLALAGFLQLMTSLGPSALQAVGRTDLHMQWAFLSLVLYLPAFALGLRWGVTGVAAGYLIATAILAPIQWGFVARVLGVQVKELWAAIYPSVAGCVVMTAAVVPTLLVLAEARVPRAITLVLVVGLGVGVYGAMMWIVQRQAVIRLVGMMGELRPRPARTRLRKAEEV
jgi:O-antigen/teichoic acid export membrane protein